MGVIIESKDCQTYKAINLDYYQYKKFYFLNCRKLLYILLKMVG